MGEDIGEETVTLARSDYERLVAAAEDALDERDAETLRAAIEQGAMESFPADSVFAMANGANPVRVLRDYRQMTAQSLADAAGLSRAYLTQIERGKRKGSLKALSAIAQALNVELALLSWTRENENAAS